MCEQKKTKTECPTCGRTSEVVTSETKCKGAATGNCNGGNVTTTTKKEKCLPCNEERPKEEREFTW